MEYEAITETEIQAGKPVTGPGGFGDKVKKDLDYLYGQLGSTEARGIPNGSFEIDSDADGVPDGWTRNLFPGGSGGFETAAPGHGARAYQFTHPGGGGNGGGTLTSGYVPCSEYMPRWIGFLHWVSAEGMKNEVKVLYYDKDKVYIDEETIFSATVGGTTPIYFMRRYQPMVGARFFKVSLIGGQTDTPVAGTAYFDDVGLISLPAWEYQSDFTINEASAYLTSWTDVTTVTLNLPQRYHRLNLTFQIEVKTQPSSYWGYLRFKVNTESGPVYSNEVSQSGSNWTAKTIDVTFASNKGGVDLVMQIRSGAAGWSVYGRKTTSVCLVGFREAS